VIYDYLINALDSWQFHFKLSWIHSSSFEGTCTLIQWWLLHKMSSNKLRWILVLHHLHLSSGHNVRLLHRWSHLRIHHKALLWLGSTHLRERWWHQHRLILIVCLRHTFLMIDRCQCVLILAFWNGANPIWLVSHLLSHGRHYNHW
jgi:hypothetical protein